MVSSTPRSLFTPGKTLYPLYRRLGGPQGQSGRAENLVPTGNFFLIFICCAIKYLWGTCICRSSRNLGASASWNPQGLSRPVVVLLYIYHFSLSSFYTRVFTLSLSLLSLRFTLIPLQILLMLSLLCLAECFQT